MNTPVHLAADEIKNVRRKIEDDEVTSAIGNRLSISWPETLATPRLKFGSLLLIY